jgi:hypothetical protein
VLRTCAECVGGIGIDRNVRDAKNQDMEKEENVPTKAQHNEEKSKKKKKKKKKHIENDGEHIDNQITKKRKKKNKKRKIIEPPAKSQAPPAPQPAKAIKTTNAKAAGEGGRGGAGGATPGPCPPPQLYYFIYRICTEPVYNFL